MVQKNPQERCELRTADVTWGLGGPGGPGWRSVRPLGLGFDPKGCAATMSGVVGQIQLQPVFVQPEDEQWFSPF